jgi:anti-sigma factor RsiW
MMEFPTGWSCERTVQRFEHYLLSTMPPREAVAVAEHLEACDGCAHRLVLFRVTLARTPRG